MAFFYLGLAFLGAVAPYSFLGQFFVNSGLDFAAIRTQMWAGPISSYFGLNTLISGLVTILFILSEGRRQKMKGLWLPLLATLLVGVACGLPLFLYLRRIAMDREISKSET
jgi:membrane associated rhomboid family serine protease